MSVTAVKAPPLAVSITEAARLLGVCRNTVYSLGRRGELRIVKLGESTRSVVPYSDLVALLDVPAPAGPGTPDRPSNGHTAADAVTSSPESITPESAPVT